MGFTISGASASASYDLYFVNSILAQRWQWRRVLSGIQCDDAGEAMFQLQHPDPYQGYFIILSAEDSDDDGLTDGYEAWFTYNGQTTTVDNPLTDSDLMKDSWEVEYGLDPTVGTGTEGEALTGTVMALQTRLSTIIITQQRQAMMPPLIRLLRHPHNVPSSQSLRPTRR